MVDKFRKVKHTGVIILGGFFGILDLAGRMGRKAGLTDGTPGGGAEWVRAIRLTMP